MHFLFGKLSDCVYLPQGCDFYIEKMTKKRMKIKRVIVAFLFCLSLTAVAQNQIKRVAILETVDKEGTLSYMKLLQFRSNLTTAITKQKASYDRADLEQIIGEHNFQRTGLVSDADIKKIGEFTGAQYVLIAEAAIDGNVRFGDGTIKFSYADVEVEVYSNYKKMVIYSDGISQKNHYDGATYESAGRNALKLAAGTVWENIKPWIIGK